MELRHANQAFAKVMQFLIFIKFIESHRISYNLTSMLFFWIPLNLCWFYASTIFSNVSFLTDIERAKHWRVQCFAAKFLLESHKTGSIHGQNSSKIVWTLEQFLYNREMTNFQLKLSNYKEIHVNLRQRNSSGVSLLLLEPWNVFALKFLLVSDFAAEFHDKSLN